VLGDGSLMGWVGADMEDAGVDIGVEGLDAAVEHLREAGQVVDVADLEAGVAEGARGAAGGDKLDPVGGEAVSERHQAILIGDAEQCAADRLKAVQVRCVSVV
jgi:hypothetical protein